MGRFFVRSKLRYLPGQAVRLAGMNAHEITKLANPMFMAKVSASILTCGARQLHPSHRPRRYGLPSSGPRIRDQK